MGELTELTSVEKLVAWPTPQDYNEAVQSPEHCFSDAELRTASPALNEFGLPRPISGGFASVYRLRTPSREVAVRCFLSRVSDRGERYQEITKFLQSIQAPWAVPCEFHPQGMYVHSEWYPIVKMEWACGETLGAWVEKHLNEPADLLKMQTQLLSLVSHLQQFGAAHGDLQPANIIVMPDDSLRLVDYDGMFVPSLAGTAANELGHKNFQHPHRSAEHFDSRLDHFSAWLLGTSLAILAIDPGLWDELKCADESFLFRHIDLADPDHSYAFSILESHDDSRIVSMARMVRWFCKQPPTELPSPIPSLTLIDVPTEDLPDVQYVAPPPVALPDREALKRNFAEQRLRRAPAHRKRRMSNLLAARGAVDLHARLSQEMNSGRRVLMLACTGAAALLLVGTITLRHYMGYDYALWSMVSNAVSPSIERQLEVGQELKAHGDLSAAGDQFDRVLAPGPTQVPTDVYIEAAFQRGQLFLWAGLPAKAKMLFETAKGMENLHGGTPVYDPDEYSLQLAFCDAELGATKSAYAVLLKALSEDPGFAFDNNSAWRPAIRLIFRDDPKAGLDLWKAWLDAATLEDPSDIQLRRVQFDFIRALEKELRQTGSAKDLAGADRISKFLNIKEPQP